MNADLHPGLMARFEFTVKDRHLASEIGSGLVSVFSTAMMIAGMETAAVQAVQKYLPEGFTTVGVHVDVSHKAATPSGMQVQFEARLLEISENGKGLVFHVEARDEAGVIGEGRHNRVIVDQSAFERKTQNRKNKDKNNQTIA